MEASNRTSDSKSLVIVFLAGLLFIFLIATGQSLQLDIIGLSYLAICIQSLAMLVFFGPRNTSLIKIYFIFSLVFLSITPWMQYTKGTIFWGGEPFNNTDHFTTNLLIFSSNFIVCLTYRVYWRTRYTSLAGSHEPQNITNSGIFTRPSILLLSVSSFLILFYLNDFSIINMFIRGVLDEERTTVVESSAISLLVGMLARLVPLFCVLYAATKMASSRLFMSVLLLILIISVFPTGVGRFLVGFVYIPIALLFFPFLRRGLTFSCILVGSIVVIFPFLNQFRNFSEHDEVKFIPEIEFFLQAHFDAHQNLTRVIQSDFISYGHQIAGVILFYIPRNIWPSKPVGTGFELSVQNNYDFNNISMPILGEGYANFGMIGSVLFIVVLSIFMSWLDGIFSEQMIKNYRMSYSGAIYLFLCGAFMFILRGDMLSSVAYLISGLSASTIVYFVASIRFIIK